MSGFDPFGDIETRGYLRNIKGLKDSGAVKLFEHTAFRLNIQGAMQALRSKPRLGYQNVLDTHKRLFSAVYPWAGQDRLATAPHLTISKGRLQDPFAEPLEIERATLHALHLGANVDRMRREPGKIMGQLAFAHPFLDGNGRTILLIHGELCRRAGFHIAWQNVEKGAYLKALTEELDRPGHALDAFLTSHIRRGALEISEAGGVISALRGLAPPGSSQSVSTTFLVAPSQAEQRMIGEAELLKFAAVKEAYDRLCRHAHAVYQKPELAITEVSRAVFEAAIDFRDEHQRFMTNEAWSPKTRERRVWNQLFSAVDDLLRVTQAVRERMAREVEASRTALQIAVPQPSVALMNALAEGKPLAPELASEFAAIQTAFDARFGVDLANLRSGRDMERIGRIHGISGAQQQDLRNVLKVVDDGARRQGEELVVERTIGEEQDLSRGI